MAHPSIILKPGDPLVAGSFGSAADLTATSPEEVAASCDLIEVRLDLLTPETRAARPWRRFTGTPVLFTARRSSEGGAGDLAANDREAMLREVLDDASLIDIEVASIPEMGGLVADLNARGLPWIASFHDFTGTPETAVLTAARENARNAGAAAFKAAFELGWDTSRIPACALFITGSDFPVSLMGMGPLAPVSRVLFAQLGSVLNYGYLGNTPTAPGQWSARQLRDAIGSVRRAGA